MKPPHRRLIERTQPALQSEAGETDARAELLKSNESASQSLALARDGSSRDPNTAEPSEQTATGSVALPRETPAGAAEADGVPLPPPPYPDALYPDDGQGSDADLVERARSDPEAFGLLYERYVDRIYSYCYHRVGNAQDAEDLTARTFHRALDALDHYEERGLPFAAWLFRIAHNLVANWHRDRSRRRFLSLDRIWSQRSEVDDPEGELERQESHDALWRAINRLPADRRDLLLYKFSSQMSNVEIGAVLKKSESAIKSLYFRTLAALRRDLEAAGWGSESDADEADEPSSVSLEPNAADEGAPADAGDPSVDTEPIIEPFSNGAPFTR